MQYDIIYCYGTDMSVSETNNVFNCQQPQLGCENNDMPVW